MKIPSRTGVTAGVTAGLQPDGGRGAPRRAVVAGLVAAGLVSSSLIMPGIAAAAPPAFPDNIVVFPNRDFVTVEGFQDHVGKTALLEVVRGGQVVGSAQHVVDAGDVAFEVNHPGGACWGEGTGLQGHADIVAGDKVVIKFDGERARRHDRRAGRCVTGDAVRVGNTLTVTGNIAAGVNQAPDRAANHQPGPQRHRDRPTRRARAARAARALRQGRLLLGSELRRRQLHRRLRVHHRGRRDRGQRRLASG